MIAQLAIALALQADSVKIGAPVTPPNLIHKVEPEYSEEAQRVGVAAATAVIQLVVGIEGKPVQVRVVRKIGFGLDENAVKAVEQWRFKPGMQNGQPVPVAATVEVNFALQGLTARYTQIHKEALRQLAGPDAAESSLGLNTVRDLAARRFPPALYSLAVLYRTGKLAQAEPGRFEALINAAADADSTQALYFLGNQLEDGQERPRNLGKALASFRRCAIAGMPACQWRLARLLDSAALPPQLIPQSPVETLAWYELALDGGVDEARARAGELAKSLTPPERAQVAQFKASVRASRRAE